MQRGDIKAKPLLVEECDDCMGTPATHYIEIDLRGTGRTRGFGHYCKQCVTREVRRIQATLPRNTKDGTVEA